MSNLPATYVEGFHNEEAVKRMKYRPLGRTGMTVSKLSFGEVHCFVKVSHFRNITGQISVQP